MNLTKAFLILLNCFITTVVVARRGQGAKILIVSFDGFALHYLKSDHHRHVLPNFGKLLQQATFTDSVRSVFPSETFPNHFSMATGLYPESHGLVSNIFYDPDFDFLYNAMGYGNDSNRELESDRWWAAEPLWVTARRHGFKTASSCWPGDRVTYQPGNMQATFQRPDFSNKTPFEERVDEMIEWLVDGDVDVGFLYNFQPDATGHRFGTKGPEMVRTLKQVDNELGYLLDKLQLFNFTRDNFNLLVVSDHGMWNMEWDIVFDDYFDTSQLFQLTTRFGANVPIWPKTGKADEIVTKLNEIANTTGNWFTAYHKADLPPSFHHQHNKRIPEVIAVGKVGAYLSPVGLSVFFN